MGDFSEDFVGKVTQKGSGNSAPTACSKRMCWVLETPVNRVLCAGDLVRGVGAKEYRQSRILAIRSRGTSPPACNCNAQSAPANGSTSPGGGSPRVPAVAGATAIISPEKGCLADHLVPATAGGDGGEVLSLANVFLG